MSRLHKLLGVNSPKFRFEPALLVKEPLEAAFDRPRTKKSPADRLFLHVSGNGEQPVIFLHDLASTHMYWLKLLNHLNQNQFRFIVPDLLGHGRSPKSPWLEYDLRTHLHYLKRDIFDGWDEPNINKIVQKPAHVIGAGMGSILALELTANFPDLVKSLTLIDFSCYEDAMQAQIANRWVGHVCYATKQTCQMTTLFFRFTFFLWASLIPLFSNKPPELVQDSMSHTTAVTYKSYQKILVRHRVDNAATRLRTPTTIIHGTDNTQIPFENIHMFFKQNAQITNLASFEGAGEDLALTRTESLAEYLNRELLSSS